MKITKLSKIDMAVEYTHPAGLSRVRGYSQTNDRPGISILPESEELQPVKWLHSILYQYIGVSSCLYKSKLSDRIFYCDETI
jgi:hypothetical protein